MLTPSTGAKPQTADQYDVSLTIIGAAGSTPLNLRTLPVAAAELLHQGFEALLGRDILQQCLLTYNGSTGEFTLAF